MAKRKQKPRFRDFESRTSNGRFIMIAEDMLRSKASADLTLQQIGLYFFFKNEFIPDKSRHGVLIEANDKNILFPDSKWKPLYRNNYRAWKNDRDALILHGFIELRECGKSTRTPNVYTLSSLWKGWPENQEEIRKRYESVTSRKARKDPEA